MKIHRETLMRLTTTDEGKGKGKPATKDCPAVPDTKAKCQPRPDYPTCYASDC